MKIGSTIRRKSRYGDIRYIRRLSSKRFMIWGKAHFMRGAEDFIDYEGGPFISLDGNLPDHGIDRVIKKIQVSVNTRKRNCYILITN